ncbi:MAG TPA: type II secretion system protein [Terriglobia bacterium]|nr:type II secretion system protein [Terriglobia bacterium]
MTLLELVVVITILTLMAGLVAPRMGPWLEAWKLRSAAERVAQTFRYARSRALFEQHFYVVQILPQQSLVKVLQQNSGVIREIPLPEGIQIIEEEELAARRTPEVFSFIFPPSGEVEEKNLWLRNSQGRTVKIHLNFLLGSPGVEIAEGGS